MGNIKVSIITAMYNSEKYIEETINSVLKQTYKNFELLIIDDSSKDNSYLIAKEFEKKDERIKVFKNSSNLGVIKTRNKAINMSKGKYIAFLDSDDLWDEKKLDIQINFMEKNDIAISCTDYSRVSENLEYINKVSVKEKITYDDLLKNNLLGCLTVVLNKEKLDKIEFLEISKNEDYLLWLELIKQVEYIYGININLASYRVLSNSRSSNKFSTAKMRWIIYRKYEKLSLLKSLYYFSYYAVTALIKNKK